jgi:hypothetical protein
MRRSSKNPVPAKVFDERFAGHIVHDMFLYKTHWPGRVNGERAPNFRGGIGRNW